MLLKLQRQKIGVDKHSSHAILTDIFYQDFHSNDNDSVGVTFSSCPIDSKGKGLFDEALLGLDRKKKVLEKIQFFLHINLMI